MFTAEERERLARGLAEAAAGDPRIAAAAVLGSAALGVADAWSDIDLGLGLADGADRAELIEDWTRRMYAEHGAVHHLDVAAGAALYRVFLLDSTLQVDLSFWPAGTLRPRGPKFRLLFGGAGEPDPPPSPAAEELIAMAWLYLLHARSSIARGRELQSRHWLDAGRDEILTLACLRRGLPTREARGADDLPGPLKEEAGRLWTRAPGREEAERVLGGLIEMLLAEAGGADHRLATRLAPTLRALGSVPPE